MNKNETLKLERMNQLEYTAFQRFLNRENIPFENVLTTLNESERDELNLIYQYFKEKFGEQ